jgi:hypothetical protein
MGSQDSVDATHTIGLGSVAGVCQRQYKRARTDRYQTVEEDPVQCGRGGLYAAGRPRSASTN